MHDEELGTADRLVRPHPGNLFAIHIVLQVVVLV